MQAQTEQDKLKYLQKLVDFAHNCHRAKDFEMAIRSYEQALEIYEDPRVLVNMAAIHTEANQLSKTIDRLNRAIEINPRNKQALLMLADAQQETGHAITAMKLRKVALTLANGNAERVKIECAIMFGATVLGTQSDYLQEQTRFCHERLRHLYPKLRALPSPVEGRKIRLGYLSADFSLHTVMILLWPLFAQHQRDDFELYFYSNNPYSDHKTDELKTLGTYRPIWHMSDRQAEATIKADGIDLLVDLSGYSSGQRLSLLARKPAPRIATGLGFITPVGCPSIDWALLDPWSLRPELQDLTPEQSAGIKSNLFFDHGEPIPLESVEHDGIVFGSGNALYKLTPPVVRLWAEILKRVPGSVLSLKSKTLDDPGVQAMVAKRFLAFGITEDRLKFTGTTSRQAHMKWYSGVDVALDPFPYQGGYTTLETLYMGCPVISLDTKGISTTTAALALSGLDSYIANNEQEYVALAYLLAMMLQSLSPESRMKIREHCRASLEQSVIMDAEAFVEDIENAYRRICE